MRAIIPECEFRQRVVNLQKLMQKEGFDAILGYGNEAEPQYCRYFSDYWPSFETAAALTPAEGEPTLLIGPESLTFAADRSKIKRIRQLKAFRESSEPEYPGKKLDTFKSVFDEVSGGKTIKRIGVAGYPLLNIDVLSALEEEAASRGATVEKASRLVNELRMKKSENELACMREAARITRETFNFVLKNAKVGMTECQVVGLALGKMHELGAERESYPCWVLAGDGSDQAISRPRQKAIKSGDMVMIQIGARYEGYASSIGRPVVFGKANDEQRKLIEAGYAVYKSVLGSIKAGVEAKEVADKHKAKIAELGYSDYYLYGPCHGNGLMEGEAPWIETASDYNLAEDMTFCADIFLGNHEKKRGLRIEDVIRVTKEGVENLTNFPTELFEL